MEYAELIDSSTVWGIDNALNVAGAFFVLVAGIMLSSFVARHAADFLPRTRAVDTTIAPLLAQVARYGILPAPWSRSDSSARGSEPTTASASTSR